MRILLLTQLFQPEPNHLKGLTFAKELAGRGHEVEVLTGFPNYPGGRIYQGYRLRWWRREILEGVSVVRVGHYPSHNRSGFLRFLSYASFAFSGSVPGLFVIRRPDLIHVYQGPGPLSLPAMILRVLFHVPYVLDVQDLWPDSVAASGMLRFPGLLYLLHGWSRLTYRLARKIVVLSEGYKAALVRRGVPPGKIEVIYNWSDENRVTAPKRTAQDIAEAGLAGRFNILFAGNLGTAQALDVVIRAARQLQDDLPVVQFVFVGDGVDAARLRNTAAELRAANVRFLSRRPIGEVKRLLDTADALLIHLKDTPLCRIGIPQKTQAYLAAGKPIIMAVRGESAEMVRRAQAGLVCEPEDAGSLSRAVRTLFRMPPAERAAMGRNGKEFYEEELAFAVGIKKMSAVFGEAAQAGDELQ